MPRGTNPRSIGQVREARAFIDDVVESMRSQDPNARPGSIEDILGEIAARRELAESARSVAALQASKLDPDQPYDPLLAEPISLVKGGAGYRGGILSLKLSQSVTPAWGQSFHQQSHHHSILEGATAKDPRSFSFAGDVMTVQIAARNVDQLMPYVREYLRDGNSQYKRDVDQRRQTEEQQKKAAIKLYPVPALTQVGVNRRTTFKVLSRLAEFFRASSGSQNL